MKIKESFHFLARGPCKDYCVLFHQLRNPKLFPRTEAEVARLRKQMDALWEQLPEVEREVFWVVAQYYAADEEKS